VASILCFGDSITQGVVDAEGGWTQRLRRRLDREATFPPGEVRFPAHAVFNLGVSDDTSEGLLARLERELEPPQLGDQTIVVIAIGANETAYELRSGRPAHQVERFAAPWPSWWPPPAATPTGARPWPDGCDHQPVVGAAAAADHVVAVGLDLVASFADRPGPVAAQPHRLDLVAVAAQPGGEAVPAPRAVPGPVDEQDVGHGRVSFSRAAGRSARTGCRRPGPRSRRSRRRPPSRPTPGPAAPCRWPGRGPRPGWPAGSAGCSSRT
jgi:hypothetical protein